MKEISANPMQSAAFLHREDAHSQVSVSFGEKMDRAAVRGAWDTVCATHDVLRARLTGTPGGGATLLVADSGGTVWDELDWQAAKPEEVPGRWAELQTADLAVPFDGRGSVRVTEIALPGGGTHYLLTSSSYLLDESSFARLMLDWLIALERPLSADEPAAATTGSPSAWSGILKPVPEPMVLHPRPPGRAEAGATWDLGREEAARFSEACKSLDPGVVVESLWALALRRLGATGNTTVRRFDVRRSQRSVGYFENWLPVVHAWDSKTWLADACARHEIAVANAWIAPGAVLTTDGAGVGGLTCGFAWGGPDINDIVHTALPRWINFDAKLTRSRPGLLLLEGRPGLSLRVHGPLGSEAAARRLLHLLAGLIQGFASYEAKPRVQIPLLPGPEARQLREMSRGPDPAEHPANALDAFRANVAKTPDAVAVRAGEHELTFLELDTLSDRLAAHLAHASLSGGWHVALFLSPSSWIAIALIGSWKAGNCCLALDPAAPPEWIEAALAAHDAGLVFCDGASAPLLDTSARRRIIIDQEWDAMELADVPRAATKPDAPAALLPGHSDGIAPVVRALTHESLVAAALEGARMLDFGPGDSILAHSAAGGGAFFDEWLIPLLGGGSVLIAGDDLLDPVHSGATHLRLTAPEWSNQAARWARGDDASESPLRVVAVEMGTASKLALDVWNHCTGGRVRTRTFFSLSGLCGLGIAGDATPDGAMLAVGRPVAGTEAAVTDDDSHDLPPGHAGHFRMRFPGWKSLSNPKGRRGIESGLRAWLSPAGDIRLEGDAAPELARGPLAAALIAENNVLDAFEGVHIWALEPCEVEGTPTVAEWPLTRGGWIDASQLPMPQAKPDPEPKPAEAAAPKPAKAATPWVPVSVLQPEGGSPLVLVPTASGVPETYRDFVAALGTGRKILGLTARGACDPDAAHRTVEGAAAEWITSLVEEDPSLAFELCGFGFGGIAALEMARQLAASRRPVPQLILIGTPPPQTEQPAGWLASVKNAFQRLKHDGRLEPFPATGEPARAHVEAWLRYRFVRCDLRARIIVPSDFPPDAAASWLAILPSARVVPVKCAWAEMLSFPAVKRLASIIADPRQH